jgi:DNA-binding response OmpR family regulator
MSKVLIVDDEPSLLQVLKMNLEIEGYEAILASDGETAVRRIQAEEPDLVLLDIMMPVMDGWDVLRTIQTLDLRKKPKVIVMTAKGERDLRKGLTLGAHAYVSKPFDTEVLLEKAREVLLTSVEELEARRGAELESIEDDQDH